MNLFSVSDSHSQWIAFPYGKESMGPGIPQRIRLARRVPRFIWTSYKKPERQDFSDFVGRYSGSQNSTQAVQFWGFKVAGIHSRRKDRIDT